MGADNWGFCPKCKQDRAERIRIAEEMVLAAYGTVPVEEYHELEMRLDNLRQSAPEYTLREDYEVHMDEDGLFYVRYGAACRCGFSYKYRYDEQMRALGEST